MKRLLLLFILVLFIVCTGCVVEEVYPSDSLPLTDKAKKVGSYNVYEFEYEGCQYISLRRVGRWNVSVTHKGNCRNH